MGSVHRTRAFLVTRAKRDVDALRVYGAPNNRKDGVRIRDDSLELIRRIRCKDPQVRQDVDIPDQQYEPYRHDHCRALESALTGGAVR